MLWRSNDVRSPWSIGEWCIYKNTHIVGFTCYTRFLEQYVFIPRADRYNWQYGKNALEHPKYITTNALINQIEPSNTANLLINEKIGAYDSISKRKNTALKQAYNPLAWSYASITLRIIFRFTESTTK